VKFGIPVASKILAQIGPSKQLQLKYVRIKDKIFFSASFSLYSNLRVKYLESVTLKNQMQQDKEFQTLPDSDKESFI